MSAAEKYTPRLQSEYQKNIRKAMQDKFEYKNVMEIPKMTKIVLNIGAGESTTDSRKAQSAADDLTTITGQKADDHIDSLAKKYLGLDEYPYRKPGERRIILRIKPEHEARNP